MNVDLRLVLSVLGSCFRRSLRTLDTYAECTDVHLYYLLVDLKR